MLPTQLSQWTRRFRKRPTGLSLLRDETSRLEQALGTTSSLLPDKGATLESCNVLLACMPEASVAGDATPKENHVRIQPMATCHACNRCPRLKRLRHDTGFEGLRITLATSSLKGFGATNPKQNVRKIFYVIVQWHLSAAISLGIRRLDVNDIGLLSNILDKAGD